MHQQIGIAPDRRREVGIASEAQAEMAEIFGTVNCLALAAQHQLIDGGFVRFAAHFGEQLVESLRPDDA